MKVLIDPRRNTFHDVVEDDAEFPVAAPLFWQTTPAGFRADRYTWDGEDFIPVLIVVPQEDALPEAKAAAKVAVLEALIRAELAKPESDIPEIETLREALGGR